MAATAADELPRGRRWSYEVKWDGYRALLAKDGQAVRLVSRNLRNLGRDFATIVGAGQRVDAASFIADGEIVAMDEQGRPSFQALQHRASASSVAYYVFDLLYRDGRDLRGEAIERRRRALAGIAWPAPIFLSEPLGGPVARLEATIRAAGLEGLVAKRLGSRYEAGRRSDAWVKVRFARRQEFVVGGYTPRGASFDSLLVGYYSGTRLLYASKVRAGFTPHARAAVHEAIAGAAATRCPFANLPTEHSGHWGEGIGAGDMASMVWVRPRVVVEVAFTEWTRDGGLRHAAFAGVRRDKRAREVVREPVG